MGLVNSVDCKSQQRNTISQDDCQIAATSCSHLHGKHPEPENQKAPDGSAPQTFLVLQRKHGRFLTSRLPKLKALSMPELEKLCTVDFTRGHERAVKRLILASTRLFLQKPGWLIILPAATLTKMDETRVICCDPGSTDEALQGTPETKQPGCSIRWEAHLILISLPVCNGFGLDPIAAQRQAGIVGNKLY